MKSEMKRWKKKNFTPSICQAKSGAISNLRDEEYDGEMKKKIGLNIHQTKV